MEKDKIENKKKELNSYILQQFNNIKENNAISLRVNEHIQHNLTQIEHIKNECRILEHGNVLRNIQNTAIEKEVNYFKDRVRSGEYGEELKNMKFSDED